MQIQIETGTKEGATGGPGRPAISVSKGLNKTAENSGLPGLLWHGCESHEGANGGRAAHFQKECLAQTLRRWPFYNGSALASFDGGWPWS
jgi:hypothetical protein